LFLPFIATLLTVGLVSVIVSLQFSAYGTLNTVVFNNNNNKMAVEWTVRVCAVSSSSGWSTSCRWWH